MRGAPQRRRLGLGDPGLSQLSDEDIATIVLKETRSLKGLTPVTAEHLAHTIMNGDALYGRARPSTAAPTPAPHLYAGEEARWAILNEAVGTARRDRREGRDPTNEATHFWLFDPTFPHRKPPPKWAKGPYTFQDGPFDNGNPLRSQELTDHNNYVRIYPDDPPRPSAPQRGEGLWLEPPEMDYPDPPPANPWYER